MADNDSRSLAPDERLDDDEPVRLEPDLPPQIASPLAPFAGELPPSPPWFKNAIDKAPERRRVEVAGAGIELLTWGEVGRPGLIFVHGNSAHADWWSFICPFFAAEHRVASLSFSGMGGSDWRETYGYETFASEIFAGGQAAGLYEADVAPIYVGHSFGGSQVFYSAARHPERMRAAVLVDTGFGGPPTAEQMEAWRKAEEAAGRPIPQRAMGGGWRGPQHRSRPNRIYPSLESALARFRFMPPQVPGNLFIADFIARRSLKRAPMPQGEVAADGGGEGWTWRFDPAFWEKLDRSGMTEAGSARAPLAHIYGDRSEIIRRHSQPPGGFGGGPSLFAPGTPTVIIPDSEHHIMVDQPLALVAALRALIAAWKP
ncbi:MAG: alpha/beta fold hydrolase [Caulobacteraceae bacterium]